MTYFTGVNGKLQWSDGTNLSAIGILGEFTATVKARTADIPAPTGNRNAPPSKVTEAIPSFTLRYTLQDFNLFSNYLVKGMVGNSSRESNYLTKFHLKYYDGSEYGQLSNIASDTVTLNVAHGRAATVEATGIAENISGGISTPSWVSDISLPPVMYRQVSTLTVNGVSVKNDFREASFTFSNNAFSDVTGNAVTPAEVMWGVVGVAGYVDVAKKTSSYYGNPLNQSRGSIVIAIADRASSPKTCTITLPSASITTVDVNLPMGLVGERVNFASNWCNISYG